MFATKNYVTTELSSQQQPALTSHNLTIWTILAFQAGWINAGGFLACFRFVTHTTGFATQFGYDVAVAKWSDALGMLTVPLFFMAGAMLSGFYVDAPLSRGQKPKFYVAFLYSTTFLTAVTALGYSGTFGPFGQNYDPVYSYLLIALLCLTAGIQNAVTSTASHNTVRTSHLTGHTTDLGIGLVRILTSSNKEKLKYEIARNQIRILVITGFILGSVVSSFVFLQVGYIGFIAPAAISAGLYWHAKRKFNVDA